jgi:hypothetical protein
MTPLDDLRAAMETDPEDDAARLRWYGALAEAELVLWLEREAAGDVIVPEVLDLPEGRFVLAFQDEERLAVLAGRPVPYAALPGRVIASMLAGQGIGLAVDAATFLPPGALVWLAGMLAGAAEATEAVPDSFLPPGQVPAAVAGGIARVIGASHVAGAWLVTALAAGRRGLMLVVAGAGAAEGDLARALREAVVFSGVEAGVLDIVFLAPDAPAVVAAQRVGMAFAPAAASAPPAAPVPPGTDPARPPRLR